MERPSTAVSIAIVVFSVSLLFNVISCCWVQFLLRSKIRRFRQLEHHQAVVGPDNCGINEMDRYEVEMAKVWYRKMNLMLILLVPLAIVAEVGFVLGALEMI